MKAERRDNNYVYSMWSS